MMQTFYFLFFLRARILILVKEHMNVPMRHSDCGQKWRPPNYIPTQWIFSPYQLNYLRQDQKIHNSTLESKCFILRAQIREFSNDSSSDNDIKQTFPPLNSTAHQQPNFPISPKSSNIYQKNNDRLQSNQPIIDQTGLVFGPPSR